VCTCTNILKVIHGEVVWIRTQLIIILVVHIEIILPVVGTVELVVNESATEKSVSPSQALMSFRNDMKKTGRNV